MLIHLLSGFLMAYIGLLPPGMLNMTTVRTTIEKGKKEGCLFALGAATVVSLHATIAFRFAEMLSQHPQWIKDLKKAGVFILLALSVFFFFQARKKFLGKGKVSKTHPYLAGLGMSLFNMLGIPFYLAGGLALQAKGYIQLNIPGTTYMVVGATLGAFFLFYTYSIAAHFISRKVSWLAHNINLILGFVFLLLALLVFYQLIY